MGMAAEIGHNAFRRPALGGLFFFLLWSLVSRPVWANQGAAFMELEIPARSGAVAAGVADSQGPESLGWNPAGIAGVEGTRLSLTHFQELGFFNYTQLDLGFAPWENGAWAFRGLYAGAPAWQEIDMNGQEAGSINYSDLFAQAAYAQSWGRGFSSGLALGIFRRNLAEYQAWGADLDLGGRYAPPWWPMQVGAVLRHVGRQQAFFQEADPLPSEFALGLGIRLGDASRQAFNLQMDYVQPLDGVSESGARWGAEYILAQMIFFRAGYRLENVMGRFSCGLGLRLQEWSLDYSFQPQVVLASRHRLTLSYEFRQEVKTAVPRELAAPAPAGEEAVLKKEFKSGAVSGPARELKMSAREFQGTVTFKTPEISARVTEWSFETRDLEGHIVRVIRGQGSPPRELSWDGRDQSGAPVDVRGRYQFIFQADRKVIAAPEVVSVAPVYKLQFEQGDELEPEAVFFFSPNPRLESWSLNFLPEDQGALNCSLQGKNQLPETIAWDGRDQKGVLADTRRRYRYRLNLAYSGDHMISIADRILPIPARRVSAPEGKVGILILNILFDFNNDQIKADMMDRIQFAGRLLAKYGNQSYGICEGHSDDRGNQQYNLELSRRRAEKVYQTLVSQWHIPQAHLSIQGYGKTRPILRKTDEESRKKNRRVEIRLFFPKN